MLIIINNDLLATFEKSHNIRYYVKSKKADGAPLPAAAYIGVKPGDVDDSYAKVAGKIIENEVEVSYDDRLLNKGESYDIEVVLNKTSEVRGGRLVFDLNVDGKPLRKEQYSRCIENLNDCMSTIFEEIIHP